MFNDTALIPASSDTYLILLSKTGAGRTPLCWLNRPQVTLGRSSGRASGLLPASLAATKMLNMQWLCAADFQTC